MGLFDKARASISSKIGRAGEETVRVIDYDEPEAVVPETSYDESAFEVSDESKGYFQKQQKRWRDQQKEEPKVEAIDPHAEKIQDVLEVHNIPLTFEIAPDILMPEDIDQLDEFDLQLPQGYDIGQVDSFKDRCLASVHFYVGLLEERNVHVAKLATVVDRLQVDLNNLRVDNQIATGINIMPTDEDEDLSQEVLELRLLLKQRDDQLKAAESGDNLSSGERARYEALRNEFALLERERDDLQEEANELRTKVAYLEEEQEDVLEPQAPAASTFAVDEDFSMPALDEEELQSPRAASVAAAPSERSAFAQDEESLEDFVAHNSDYFAAEEGSSNIEVLDDEGHYNSANFGDFQNPMDEDDDDEDELDKLMKEWNTQ